MRLDTYAKQVAHQYLSNDDLALIRKTAVEMAGNVETIPVGTVLLKMLNHINLITADKADMVDVLALQEKLTDRETRLRENGKAYFQLSMETERLDEENKRLKEQIKLLEARVNEITTGAC